METLEKRLLRYLEVLSGERPDLDRRKVAALPLFLRERYALYSARLFGRPSLLALETQGWESGSPGEYGKHAEMLRQHTGEPAVLVIPQLPSHARNHMVRMGIAFIVPGSQTFMPNRFIDLRERFAQPVAARRETLSPAAQCIVLFHLLRGPLGSMPLKEIAATTGYSPMKMTNVKDELEALELCGTSRSGRFVQLRFESDRRALWGRTLPHLTSPVRKRHWIRWPDHSPPVLLAGLSALSQQTMIADDRLPTYAATRTTYQHLLEQGTCAGCPDAESASGRIEVWSYDPQRLTDGPLVDALSLFLSLRHSADERIQQQLEKLLEGVKW